VISLSSCVTELGVGGVERRALAKAFQHTKEHQIKSYDHLKLLVCIKVFGLCSTVF
jgi:hypothetical protein